MPLMRIVQWFRKIASRNKWSMRLLGLPQSDTAEDVPGLVLIQIDGLSMTQFQKALQAGRLPFLEKQIRNGRWGCKPMYSGMPSTTPAFQGELFYGVKSCVPAFEFISRSEQQRHVSFYPRPHFNLCHTQRTGLVPDQAGCGQRRSHCVCQFSGL